MASSSSSTAVDKEKEKAERGVDSVTDYVEERSIGGDEEKVKASLSGLQMAPQAAKGSSFVIRAEDVDTVVEECNVTKVRAEQYLRQSEGSCQLAISAYIRGE